MEALPDFRQNPLSRSLRILMICPLCGHETLEAAPSVYRSGSYACNGDGCDYRFDLARGTRKSLAEGFSAMWRRFYAALTPAE